MIHLVHKSNRALYARELGDLPRLGAPPPGRFVPVLDSQTRHLLALESDGEVGGMVQLGARRRKPDGAARAVGEARVWEITHLQAAGGGCNTHELHLAVIELALAHNVGKVSTRIEAGDLPAFTQAFWTVAFPAFSLRDGEDRRIAVELDCNRGALTRMRTHFGILGDVMVRIEPGVFPPDLTPYGIEALIASQSALSAGEVIEILTVARRSSAQDNRVFARIVRRIADIQRLEGDEAAFDAINRLYAATTLKTDASSEATAEPMVEAPALH